MTKKMKLKYFLITIVLIGLCILSTAFPIKTNKVVIDLTYGVLLLIAFLFGGWVCGISGVAGICLFNLLKNNSSWLSLLGLIIGLTFGVMAWLTKRWYDKESFDKSAPMIACGSFFLGIAIIFTTVRCCVGSYYVIRGIELAIQFYWPLYVLPWIIGVIFLVLAFFYKKTPEYVQKPLIYTSMIAPVSFTIYCLVAALCSLSTKLSFANSMANAYNNYIMNFLIAGFICILGAIVIYIGFALILKLRKYLKSLV